MFRLLVCTISLTLTACQSEANGDPTPAKVQIVDAGPVEATDLFAMGGFIRDPQDPFWQVVIDRSGIQLNGVASPTPHSMVTLPPVKSTVSGATETWVTEASGKKVQIRAIRERCVRPDGFVFRQTVRVDVGSRAFVTCGNRGSDPQATKR
jgi:uncharacterized membrane protein